MSGLRTQLDWCTKAQALLGLTLGLVVVGFSLFGYRPTSMKLRELQDQIDAKRRELDRNVAQVRVLPAVTLAVNELRSRVEKYDKQLPRQQELDRFIKDINTMVL